MADVAKAAADDNDTDAVRVAATTAIAVLLSAERSVVAAKVALDSDFGWYVDSMVHLFLT